MKSPLPLIALLLGASIGCAGPVRVVFDGRQDFARYRTWAWAPGTSHLIDAPDADPRLVHARIAPLIEEQLRAHDLVRAPRRRADLLVAYRLIVRRQHVRVTRRGPARTLSGLDGSRYIIEAPVTELRTYEHSRLAIGLFGPDGRLVWLGELDRRVPRSIEPHLGEVVAGVLGRYPPPSRPGGRGPAHPPELEEGERMFAALFEGLGPAGDAVEASEELP